MLSCLGIVRVAHMPTFLSVEPANYCMLRCPACPVGMRHEQPQALQLSEELLSLLLQECAPYAHTIIFYFQGEPLLHKHLPQLVSMAHRYRLYTIISTNGQLLDADYALRLVQAGINKVIVSIDGFTQQSYEAYRIGGSCQKAMNALHCLRQAKQQLHTDTQIELQCLRLKSNEQEWDIARKHYKEWGADKLVFKTAQFYDYEQGNPLMPTQERYSRYRLGTDGHYHLKRTLHNRCYRLWSGAVMTVEGNILPCCFDKTGNCSFGQLTPDTSLRTIWHSDKANAFRQRLLQQRKDIDICQNCTE